MPKKKTRKKAKKVVRRRRRKLTHTKIADRAKNFLRNKYGRQYGKPDLNIKTEASMERGRVDLVLRVYKRTLADRVKPIGRWFFSDESLKAELKKRPHTLERLILCEVKSKAAGFKKGFAQVQEYRKRAVKSGWVRNEDSVDMFLAFPEEEYIKLDKTQKDLLKEENIGLIVWYRSGRVGIPIKVEH